MSFKFKIKLAEEDKTEWIHVDSLNIHYDWMFNSVDISFEYPLNGDFCNWIYDQLTNHQNVKHDFYINNSNTDMVIKKGAVQSFSSDFSDGESIKANMNIIYRKHYIPDEDSIVKLETKSDKICWKKYGF